MNTEEIKENIKGIIGREILFFPVVESTNTTAFEKAGSSGEGLVILADSQKKGRGRMGRIWISPPGVNVYMSIILRPLIEPAYATLMTLMAGIACTTALKNITGMDIAIKWPNDLTFQNRKIGGILSELRTEHGRIAFAVLGIGINVNTDIAEFPEDIKVIATSLKNETGKSYSRTQIVAGILNELDVWYKVLLKDRQQILTKWKELTSTLGKQVRVAAGKETVEGYAESIDETGMLLLRLPSGELRKIISGDLAILL